MEFRIIIKRRLKELHMTQKALAEKVGISENAMTSIITGKAYPSTKTFIKIMDILDMEILFISKENITRL